MAEDIELLARCANGEISPEIEGRFPFYSLTAPGMPLPGPDFVNAAVAMGDPPPTYVGKGREQRLAAHGHNLAYLYRRALYDNEFCLPIQFHKALPSVHFVPGHIWGEQTVNFGGGPRPADVLVLGKLPGKEEIQAGRNFVGPTSEVLVDSLAELGFQPDEYYRWYLCNLVRFGKLDPTTEALPQVYIKNCLPLLHQELRLVRPRFILCLGSEASKAILGPAGSVTNMVGRTTEFTFPINEAHEPETLHTARVVALTHPAAVYRKPELTDAFKAQLTLFRDVTQGITLGNVETDVDHRVICTEKALAKLVDEILADPDPESTIIAVDAEWHGDAPTEPGAYLRTVQFSHKDKFAACVVLRHQGGAPAFKPSIAAAVPHLKRLLKSTPGRRVRVGGHFFRSDLPWLIDLGLDLREEYAPDPRPGHYREGGWDSGLCYHAYNETARFKLEEMATRLTTVPRYDTELLKWRDAYCKQHKLKGEDLEGYGDCPPEILYPYACLHYDSLVQLADGSWVKIGKLVNSRYTGQVKAWRGGQVVDATVTNWHRHVVGQKLWFKLRTDSTPSGRWGLMGPTFTPDHKVLTRRGKVAVEQLIIDEDAIITDEREFSAAQLSVFLGSLLGDGGYMEQNGCRLGFGFGQRIIKAAYAHWKATVFADRHPAPVESGPFTRRYALPFSRYMRYLSQRFPVHTAAEHSHRKAIISADLLAALGDLGLAVWYQDDGTLVNKPGKGLSSRIYCRLPEVEQQIVVAWLSKKFGSGVRYNTKNHFIQLSRTAFRRFHEAIAPCMHPAMAYKTTLPVGEPPVLPHGQQPFCDVVREVVQWTPPAGRRGGGTRFCLTVEGAGNFLTQVGFVSNCYDADATRRCYMRFYAEGGLLDRDWHDCNVWRPYIINHMASLAFLEMEMTGIPIDRKRADELATKFMAASQRLLQEIRQELNWDAQEGREPFNPDSTFDLRAVLFGPEYGVRKHKPVEQVLPPGAITFRLSPIKTTGRRSKMWSDVVARRQAHFYKPSTDKETLGALGYQNKTVAKIRDYKFINQVLRGSLRPPLMDGGEPLEDEDGNYVYEKGVVGSIRVDGRVHTHLFTTKETGRASSARPPLQNWSNRREDDYKRVLRHDYTHPVRSLMVAPPGYVLAESDLQVAEIAVLGWLSQDANLIDHARRSCLPDTHPDHYDIHAQQAVRAFNLTCKPTKKGLKEAGCPGLRVAAKCVVAGSKLHTGSGWLDVADLAGRISVDDWDHFDGQEVVANDGTPTPLVGVYNGGRRRCLRVETEYGFELTGTYEHQYRVIDAVGNYVFKLAADLKIGDWICVRRGLGPFGRNTKVPTIPCQPRTSFKSIGLPSRFSEDWAAFLGLYASEGNADPVSGAVQLGISADNCREFCSLTGALLRRLFGDRLLDPGENELGVVHWRIMSVELARWLTTFLGASSGDKRVPDFVFRWPRRLLQVFLSWLFEGDGSSKTHGEYKGRKKSFRITYSSKSCELVKATQLLLSGFGVIATRSSESRADYPGLYWTLDLRGNSSRDAFLRHIGFVTQRKSGKCRAEGAYRQDRDVIPHQVEHLRLMLPGLTGIPREKCRECIRERSRVALSPTRLGIILDAVVVSKLTEQGCAAYTHLTKIRELPISFQPVSGLHDAGIQKVYDVTTTGEHVVAYDAILTHQSVNFGVPYARGAPAISRQCAEEGVTTSVEQCQQLIDAYFAQYPAVETFLAACRRAVVDPGWMQTPFGRKRRFIKTSDQQVLADQERQAQNFLIQSGVADAIYLLLYNLYEYRREHPELDFKFLLQMHDAFLACVRIDQAKHFTEVVVPHCLQQVPFWPCYIDGTRMPHITSPYYFGVESKLCLHWGESLEDEELADLGIAG